MVLLEMSAKLGGPRQPKGSKKVGSNLPSLRSQCGPSRFESDCGGIKGTWLDPSVFHIFQVSFSVQNSSPLGYVLRGSSEVTHRKPLALLNIS